ncbi:MAG: MazG nucleotide pyrophosphohydrolase domain-containing protein [Patescibacteria group bacterium]|jgi:NTP pyrophosphatase (non-canonical NTP hydrolase)
MNKYQSQIKDFAVERDWSQFHNPKDLLLGIVEEIGEIRNIIKWEQDPETLRKVLNDNKAKLEDEIGDIYWFLALLANGTDIDIDQAIENVIANNKKRFPVKKVKSRHTNLYLGGSDGQYEK